MILGSSSMHDDIKKWKKLLAEQDSEQESESEQIDKVSKDPLYIIKIKEPSEAVQVAAMQKHLSTRVRDRIFSSLIQFIQHPTDQVQIMALTKAENRDFGGGVFEIENIKNPSWNNDKIKNLITRYMLDDLNNFSGRGAAHMYRILADKNCPWTELDLFQKSNKFRTAYRKFYSRDP